MFYLIRFQQGEGCDYTIGCGTAVDKLRATNVLDALEEAKKLVFGDEPEYYDPARDERRLRHAMLVADTAPVPLADWYAEKEALARAFAQQQRDAAEQAEFKRLQAKFKGE